LKINLPDRRFVDASIFINWLKATPAAVVDDVVATSGFILYRIETGEEALTTVTTKDEVAIWLSRYRVTALGTFLELLLGYTALQIVTPSKEDQIEAGKLMGRYRLGYSDLLNLQAMKRHGVKEVYSSDAGFDTAPGIRRVFDELRGETEYREFLDMLERASRKS